MPDPAFPKQEAGDKLAKTLPQAPADHGLGGASVPVSSGTMTEGQKRADPCPSRSKSRSPTTPGIPGEAALIQTLASDSSTERLYKISPACKNCYMFRDQRRYGHDPTKVIRTKT